MCGITYLPEHWSEYSGLTALSNWRATSAWFQISWQEITEFVNWSQGIVANCEGSCVVRMVWPHCNCDHDGMIAFITTGRVKKIHIAYQLRCLFAMKPLTITFAHAPGQLNKQADILSRDQFCPFGSSGRATANSSTSNVGRGTGQAGQPSEWPRFETHLGYTNL